MTTNISDADAADIRLLAKRVGDNILKKAPQTLRAMTVIDILYKSMLAVGTPLVGPVRGTLFRVVQQTPRERFKLLFEPGPECYGNPGRKFYEHCMKIDQEPVLAMPLSACRVADTGETIYPCITRYGVSLAYLSGQGGKDGPVEDVAERVVSLPSDRMALGVHMEVKDFAGALTEGAIVPLGSDGAEDPESVHAAWDVFTDHSFFFDEERTAMPASIMEDGQHALFHWPEMDLPLLAVACSTFFIDMLYESSRQGFDTMERPLDVFLWRLLDEVSLCEEHENERSKILKKMGSYEAALTTRKLISNKTFEGLYLPFLHADDQRNFYNAYLNDHECNIVQRRFLSFVYKRQIIRNEIYGVIFFNRWSQVPWDKKRIDGKQPTGAKSLRIPIMDEISPATHSTMEYLALHEWTQDCLRQIHSFYENQTSRIPHAVRSTLASPPAGVQHNIFTRPHDIGRDALAVENRPIADFRYNDSLFASAGAHIQPMRQYCCWCIEPMNNCLQFMEQSPFLGMRHSGFGKRNTIRMAEDLEDAIYVPGLLGIPTIPVDKKGNPKPESMQYFLKRDENAVKYEEACRQYRRTGDGPCMSKGLPKPKEKRIEIMPSYVFDLQPYDKNKEYYEKDIPYKTGYSRGLSDAVGYYANLYPTFMHPRKEDLEREEREEQEEMAIGR